MSFYCLCSGQTTLGLSHRSLFGKGLRYQFGGWSRCSPDRQYYHQHHSLKQPEHQQQRQYDLISQPIQSRCFSNSNRGGGRFRIEFFNKVERFLDRIWTRWLYFRYEGSSPPQPQSFTVKQKMKGNILNLLILLGIVFIAVVGGNFDPHNPAPVYFGVKLWPDNMSEYEDLLNARHGRVRSKPSSPSTSSPPPTTGTSTTVSTPANSTSPTITTSEFT